MSTPTDLRVIPLQTTARPAPSDAPDLEALPLLIPVPKAAQLLGISRASAYRLAASGEIPSRRLGGRVYVVTASLREIASAA